MTENNADISDAEVWYLGTGMWFDAICSGVMTASIWYYVYYLPETTVICPIYDNRSGVYADLAGVFGSLLGFVLAILAVIVSYATADQKMHPTEKRALRLAYIVYSESIACLGIITLGCIAAVFVNYKYSLYCLLFFAVLGVMRIYRCIRVLHHIVHIASRRLE